MVLKVSESQKTRLEELSANTAVVEERLKEAELICGQVVYPAVNELRYLARNLANVLAISLDGGSAQRDQLFERHLLDAELCCQRANHDITDAVFTYIALEIDSVRKSVGASLIQGYFNDYSEQMKNLQAVHDLMAKSRGSERARRIEIYQDLYNNYLPGILDFYKTLLTHKELLGEHFRSIKRTQIVIRAGAVFAFIASLASILSFFEITVSDVWSVELVNPPISVEMPDEPESVPSEN